MRCLVLGCGNLLAADDAVGLWVVRYLKELTLEKGPAGPGASCKEPGGQEPDGQELSGQAPASDGVREKLGKVKIDSGPEFAAGRERKIALPPGTVLLEVGTPGLNLLDCWETEDRVILVDAIRSGQPPGTIQRLTLPELLSMERLPIMAAHGWGIIEALALARLTGNLPAGLVLIGIEIASEEPFQIGLSPAVEQAIVPASRAVLSEILQL